MTFKKPNISYKTTRKNTRLSEFEDENKHKEPKKPDSGRV